MSNMTKDRKNVCRQKRNGKHLIGILSLVLAISLMLCSCGSKTALTKDTFISNATSYGLETSDAGVSADGLVSGTVAYKAEGNNAAWQAEFYVLNSEDRAKEMFENNKANFESGSGSQSSASVGNYSTYEKTGDGKFKYLCRVDATLLYIDINEAYKEAAKGFIKQIGY